jgi:hypothetical protein
MDEWLETLDDDAREYYEERAGIAQFDAGMTREEAELAARELTEAYLQRRQNQK